MSEKYFSYCGIPVHYSATFTELKKLIDVKNYSSVFIVTDNNCRKHCLPVLRSGLKDIKKAELIIIKAGESNKKWKWMEFIISVLTKNNADRKSCIINLGGGMISDLGGFAAAVYKRGIDYINIPTSLLAMVDASIGSKTGIDFRDYKNQIGTVKHPAAVIINPTFLKTLPFKEMMNGVAESIKHSLCDSKNHYDLVLKNLKDYHYDPIIESSVRYKTSIVEQDLYEQNKRKILNFGHTTGHAIESLLLARKEDTKHGYCIAYGMVAELELSRIIYDLDKDVWNEVYELLRLIYPLLPLKKSDTKKILVLMKQDKKNVKNEYRFTLLKQIGEPSTDINASDKQVATALENCIEIMRM